MTPQSVLRVAALAVLGCMYIGVVAGIPIVLMHFVWKFW
jgi:hypothetical protein